MEFLQEDDVAALKKDLEPEFTLDQATGIIEIVLAGRRDAYIAGAAQAPDGLFRARLFSGALASAYYRVEEDVYLAVALTLEEKEDPEEHNHLWDAYLGNDRGFKRLFRHGAIDHMSQFSKIKQKVDAFADYDIDELIASEGAVARATGLARRALEENQAVRDAERERIRLLAEQDS